MHTTLTVRPDLNLSFDLCEILHITHIGDKVQRSLNPDDWKPLPSVGPGVREIRIRASDGIFRVIYVANIGESVFVLHAFQKKSQRTRVTDLQLARSRFKAIKGKQK
ncbi:MAG: type II toxin-antitoxin system RelE/ParE family toxin [Pseudomonadales bacterium]|nr:type II toxin-antitoxin system RelE/ParE family toxin [Pseudomonadales bacterium]